MNRNTKNSNRLRHNAQPSITGTSCPGNGNQMIRRRNIYFESRGTPGLRSYRVFRLLLASLGIIIACSVVVYVRVLLVHINQGTTKIDEDKSLNSKINNIIHKDSQGNQLSMSNKTVQLEPLRPIDYEQYTVRMNTWRRPEQLIVSAKHHASCPGAKQIQIVWCDDENDPPAELLTEMTRNNKIIIERHGKNSLNERFNILEPAPTIGILSIDDDVLRPCEAIDSGFFKWMKSPHRMVGFDARTYVETEDGAWKYGYLSTTKKENRYSLSLTRYCFIHRDYMTYYMDLPKTILKSVATNFNCEDIAMSLMISSHTQGQPPLLADLWAMNSMLKLNVDAKISGGGSHKKLRDDCMDSFALLLRLKSNDKNVKATKVGLQRAQWVQKTTTPWGYFNCGAKEDERKIVPYTKSIREIDLDRTLESLRSGKKDLQEYLIKLISRAGKEANTKGLLTKKKWV